VLPATLNDDGGAISVRTKRRSPGAGWGRSGSAWGSIRVIPGHRADHPTTIERVGGSAVQDSGGTEDLVCHRPRWPSRTCRQEQSPSPVHGDQRSTKPSLWSWMVRSMTWNDSDPTPRRFQSGPPSTGDRRSSSTLMARRRHSAWRATPGRTLGWQRRSWMPFACQSRRQEATAARRTPRRVPGPGPFLWARLDETAHTV